MSSEFVAQAPRICRLRCRSLDSRRFVQTHRFVSVVLPLDRSSSVEIGLRILPSAPLESGLVCLGLTTRYTQRRDGSLDACDSIVQKYLSLCANASCEPSSVA